MVEMWFTQFRCCSTSASVAESSGRSIEVTTDETIQDMVVAERKMRFREILEARVTLHGSVVQIWYDRLGVRQPSDRWVLRFLKIDSKHNMFDVVQPQSG